MSRTLPSAFRDSLLLSLLLAVGDYSIAEDSNWTPPESLEDLPVVEELPELMQFADGRLVQSRADWEVRRRELKAMIQFYEYGHLPPQPDRVIAEDAVVSPIPVCEGTEERLTLVIDSAKKVRMRIAVYRPPSKERLPVIIREEHALGHLQEVPQILDRGYMFVEFAREDLDPDLPDKSGSAQTAWPEHDWATLAVWAWGAMRVVDYLESRSDVDQQRIGITGHSRGGKAALLAGALDERFTLVAPNGSGCGGAGCFRHQPKGVETLELITRPERFGYWFHPRLRWFADREKKLPIDQHFLKALVAPRALICTDALGDVWANPEGNRKTTAAADDVYRLYDARDRNALHFRAGQHDLTPDDWETILDFADWHFHGRRPQDTDRFFQSTSDDNR